MPASLADHPSATSIVTVNVLPSPVVRSSHMTAETLISSSCETPAVAVMIAAAK